MDEKNHKKSFIWYKKPLVYVAFTLIILFYVPVPAVYHPMKVIVSLMVISYALYLGEHTKRYSEDNDYEITKDRMDEVKKELESIQDKWN